MMLAIREKHGNCVELLLQSGASVNAITREGDTPLSQAISSRDQDDNGSMDIIRNIITHGAELQPLPPNYNPDQQRGKDFLYYSLTPLDLAVSNDDEQVTELLLKAGADPNYGGVRNRYPLVTAALYGCDKSMEVR